MVVDEQELLFNDLLKKANYLKECLWQGNFRKKTKTKKKWARWC